MLGSDLAHAGRRLDTIGIGVGDLDDARRAMDAIARGRPLMDADLRSIAAARRAAERAWEGLARVSRDPRPETIDSMVEGMALAIEPEAERLARLAVEETGYGNVPDKRLKNLFNSLSVAEWAPERAHPWECCGGTRRRRSPRSGSRWGWWPR